MAFSRNAILVSAVVLGVSHLVLAQLRNTAPETIRSCYQNITARNRATRQPMHIDNLIAIVRKLEEKSDYLWNMRRLSRTLVNRFQFDGMSHDPDKTIDLEYSPDSREITKTHILQGMIPSSDILAEGWLDNDERCALHWMLSHSLNATLRDDQKIERYGRMSQGLRAKRATIVPTTNRPVESGVVYTKWGHISAGRVLGAIAAALEPGTDIPVIYKPSITGQSYPDASGGGYPASPGSGTGGGYPANPGSGTGGSFPGNSGSDWGNSNPNNNNNYNNRNQQGWGKRKKRQATTSFVSLKSIHVATLAGDIGQAALYNAPYNLDSRPLPDGTWNDTICPREFILDALPDPTADGHHEHDTWTYMTAAEVRGGMDGLILASKVQDLSNKGYRLSQVLEMYYSEEGLAGESGYRSCERSSLFSTVDQGALREQARSFAYYYNSKVHEITIDEQNLNVFENLVNKAFQRLGSVTGNSVPCDLRAPPVSGGTVEIPDKDKIVKPMGTFYAILDYSVPYADILQQQRLVAKLAFELDVSPSGSRLGLVNVASGNLMVSPNFTDNAAILACRILSERIYTTTTNLPAVLTGLKAELKKVRDQEQQMGYDRGVGNGNTVLIFVQGKKLEENQRADIIRVLSEYRDEFGDTRVIYASSKLQKSDFENFLLNKEDFIPIQQGSGNLSDSSELFTKEVLQKSQGKLYYPRCDREKFPGQIEEHKLGQNIFVNPNTIQYFSVSPDYFFRSIDLRLRFTSDNGKVRVCYSRYDLTPTKDEANTNYEIICKETSGTYESPETGRADQEFVVTRPCEKQKREGCTPIYLSITPTSYPALGSSGPDCAVFGCTSPDQVKVTWTHWGMTCGGFKTAVSGPVVLLAAMFSLLFKYL